MTFATARLCDAHAQEAHFQIVEPLFKSYGEKPVFWGRITTLKAFEDHALIETALQEPADGRVLVVDGGGSHRCALVDVELARLAVANGWQGLLLYGCVRDTALLAELPIGIRALHAHPLQSHQKNIGDRDLPLTFAGVNFKKDHFLYADHDGIVVSDRMLS
ncbi:ribonuclease E activity regulator RraA [Methylomicrobium sp. Wu6]|uniref:ribonuclease E activity regulator RraA n=1 Tax=Methylomicrobium sp. Wu6 TaxID=3107928 RepID=UPI002DD66C0B|nr:ribonuclease E activity regulator RraA [Methylomicrobium sp. Wu6]MEC4749942.1 ribonuclease E activity regulator RraA [Methylomicrobium sp. Wu6]